MGSRLAGAALVVVLGLVNWSILSKERHLAEGRIVYLELAPVDPRSLMQGDYMALRFGVANEVADALRGSEETTRSRHDRTAADGNVILRLDGRGVGVFERLDEGAEPAADEVRVRYRVRDGEVKFATNAFFFQEGDGPIYQPARYGQFRVDGRGQLLLTAMYDRDLNRLSAEASEGEP